MPVNYVRHASQGVNNRSKRYSSCTRPVRRCACSAHLWSDSHSTSHLDCGLYSILATPTALQSFLPIRCSLQVILQAPERNPSSHLVRLLCLRQFDGRLTHIPQNLSTQAPMGQHFENATISGGSFLHVDENYHHCSSAGQFRSRISIFQKLSLNSRHPNP